MSEFMRSVYFLGRLTYRLSADQAFTMAFCAVRVAEVDYSEFGRWADLFRPMPADKTAAFRGLVRGARVLR